jgi:hypothetical protein
MMAVSMVQALASVEEMLRQESAFTLDPLAPPEHRSRHVEMMRSAKEFLASMHAILLAGGKRADA